MRLERKAYTKRKIDHCRFFSYHASHFSFAFHFSNHKAMEAQRDKAMKKCELAQADAATASRVASKARAHLEDATAIKA